MATRPSTYNFAAQFGEDWLLFNGYTGAMLKLNATEQSLVATLLEQTDQIVEATEATRELWPSLLACGVLVDDSVDEAGRLLAQIEAASWRDETLDVVIAPTYECNFRCTYCYVSFVPGRMDADVERQVARFFDRAMDRYRSVTVGWFGGEPLLLPGTITRISRSILESASRKKRDARVMLTTNGYLLTPEMTRKITEAGIRYVHFTLDGGAETHDSTRVLRGGQPSHAVVLRNLLAMRASFPQVHVTLRMNADDDNLASCAAFLEQVPPEVRSAIQLCIAPIERGETAPSIATYRAINGVLRRGIELGYGYYDSQIPVRRFAFCTADGRSSLHIGPDGTVYKCSPSDKPEARVGRLSDDGELILSDGFERWHGAPTIHDECRDCRFLCFCAGGCRLRRLRGEPEPGCRNRYADMEGLVVNRYLGNLA